MDINIQTVIGEGSAGCFLKESYGKGMNGESGFLTGQMLLFSSKQSRSNNTEDIEEPQRTLEQKEKPSSNRDIKAQMSR